MILPKLTRVSIAAARQGRPSQTDRPTGRIPAIEAARGAAALAVVGFHWWTFHDRSIGWADPLGYGWLGVQLFFVISGFVLYLPYASGERRLDLASFAAARFLRIFPAWWTAVIVAGLVTGITWGWANLGQLALLQLWWAPEHDPVPQGWSLSAELVFYASLPLLVWAFARYRAARVPMLLALISVGWLVAVPLYQDHRVFTPLTWIDQFAFGMLAAIVVTRGVRVRWWVAVAALVLAAWILSLEKSSAPAPYGYPFPSLAAACFAVAVAWLATSSFRVPRAFVWTGTVSYGVYLWHLPLLAMAVDGWLWDLPDPVELLLVAAASLVLGWLSWRIVEQPALRQRHRVTALVRGVGARPATVAAAAVAVFVLAGCGGNGSDPEAWARDHFSSDKLTVSDAECEPAPAGTFRCVVRVVHETGPMLLTGNVKCSPDCVWRDSG